MNYLLDKLQTNVQLFRVWHNATTAFHECQAVGQCVILNLILSLPFHLILSLMRITSSTLKGTGDRRSFALESNGGRKGLAR